MPKPGDYRRREARAIKWLAEHGIKLIEQIELDVCETRKYKFDGVSKNKKTVVEIKTNDMPKKGKLRDAQLTEASEACLLMLGVKNAKRRILALTQKKFYEALMKERQACLYQSLGIEIKPTFD
jgi:CRISPR/Cas system-associated exonuclease Cas4 (RecB family)